MNYYNRHLGDYAKDTKHLSLAEHGAFCLLLDYFYATERPIPDDRCERIATAYADHERKAVRSVLAEFFTQTPDGWINKRAMAEIEAYRAKSLKAKASADARWAKKDANAYASASKAHSERNASQEPVTSNQEPIKEQVPKASPSGSRLPADWTLPDEWRRWAEAERPELDLTREAETFADHWHAAAGAKGRKANWQATWRNWIRNSRNGDGNAKRTQPRESLSAKSERLNRLQDEREAAYASLN